MLSRLIHSRLTAAVPLAPVLILVVLFFGFNAKFVECRKETPCRLVPAAALFVADHSLKVNPARGTLNVRPTVDPDTIRDAEAAAKARAVNEAARLRMLASAAKRHGGRFVWGFFVGLGFLVSLGAFGVAAIMLTRSSAEDPGRYRIRFAGAFIPALALGIWMYLNPSEHMSFMEVALARTVASGKAALGEPHAATVMYGANAVQMAAALALIIACCIVLGPHRPRDADPAEVHADDAAGQLRHSLSPITHRLRLLRIYLYVSTLLLVVGVLRMQAVMDWLLAFISPEDAEVLAGLTTNVTSVVGAFYSLMLASVYLPAAYLLRARADEMITRASVSAEVEKEIRGSTVLSQSLDTTLPRIAALLGPLLAGPFASLLERL